MNDNQKGNRLKACLLFVAVCIQLVLVNSSSAQSEADDFLYELKNLERSLQTDWFGEAHYYAQRISSKAMEDGSAQMNLKSYEDTLAFHKSRIAWSIEEFLSIAVEMSCVARRTV